ncbi:MAG: hypothetical protein JRN48_05860 [Nitrososphaerota archaeon]|nr:hypothetical protein [Nitrososphaerota archaeon]
MPKVPRLRTLASAGVTPGRLVKILPMLNARPNRPSQTTGWTRDMISWMGFLYHFTRSLLVSAHRP